MRELRLPAPELQSARCAVRTLSMARPCKAVGWSLAAPQSVSALRGPCGSRDDGCNSGRCPRPAALLHVCGIARMRARVLGVTPPGRGVARVGAGTSALPVCWTPRPALVSQQPTTTGRAREALRRAGRAPWTHV